MSCGIVRKTKPCSFFGFGTVWRNERTNRLPRIGATVADRSAPTLERIEHLTVFEDLGEELFDCADETAWLARLAAAAGDDPH